MSDGRVVHSTELDVAPSSSIEASPLSASNGTRVHINFAKAPYRQLASSATTSYPWMIPFAERLLALAEFY